MTDDVEGLFRQVAKILADADAAKAEEFAALGSQIPEGGPPTHTDLLDDDESPGEYWRHTYPMYPVVIDGIITAWQCDGCGHEQAP
jgi:hypothetical protein